MTNANLSTAFQTLARLMEYHGENAFKIRSYSKVADLLKKADVGFDTLSRQQLLATDGIGKAIADKIDELNTNGELELYRRYVAKTPPLAIELLRVKGLGIKKVRQLIEELGVTSIGELLQAVDENRVVQLKGFSSVTQAKLGAQLNFFEASRGQLRYADALARATPLLEGLRQNTSRAEFAGDLRRQCNTVAELDFACVPTDALRVQLAEDGFQLCGGVYVNDDQSPRLRVFFGEAKSFGTAWLRATGASDYLASRPDLLRAGDFRDERALFASVGRTYRPAAQRELAAPSPPTPSSELIKCSDVRGVVHAHTTASDGSATLPVLAKAVRDAGYEYLTVTDHSKAAGYANGLSIERLRSQVVEICEYNSAHSKFRVFAGTECDILRDGSLDYPDEVLAELDIVIASVHSVLSMSPADATERLIRAVRNPHTTMLGHPTGRLLLSREGYAPDMPTVLRACAENEVAVEINASAMRLDLDWTHVPLALELGVKLSINPDAHAIAHLNNIRYGVAAAQKAGVRPSDCLNCLHAEAFGTFLAERKRRKGIS